MENLQEQISILILNGYTEEEAKELLACLDDLPVEGEKEAWTPKDLKDVAWIVKKCHEIKKQASKPIEIFDDEIKKLQAQINKLKQEQECIAIMAEKKVTYLKGKWQPQCEDIIREELEGSKTKSIKLPYGIVGFRKTSTKCLIKDEQSAIDWARSYGHPSFIKVKESISLAEVKKYMQDNEYSDVEFGGDVIAELEGGNEEFKFEVE